MAFSTKLNISFLITSFLTIIMALTFSFVFVPRQIKAYVQCEDNHTFIEHFCGTDSWGCRVCNTTAVTYDCIRSTCTSNTTVYSGCAMGGPSSCPTSCVPSGGSHPSCNGDPEPPPTSPPINTPIPIPTNTPIPTPTGFDCGACNKIKSEESRYECGPIGSCSTCQRRTKITTYVYENCDIVCNVKDDCIPDNSCDGGNPANCASQSGPPTATLSGPNFINVNTTGNFSVTATGSQNIRRIICSRAQRNYNPPDPYGWHTIYDDNTCNSTSCTRDFSWTPVAADVNSTYGNDWYVVCNAYYDINAGGDSSSRCTGNPWHSFPDASWSDCGPNYPSDPHDNILVDITGYVQGRVATLGTSGNMPYYSPNCSINGCPNGSCSLRSGLSVSCTSTTINWGCNSSGAYYVMGLPFYDYNTSISCTASNPPTGYQFAYWSLSNGASTNGSCSGGSCTVNFQVKGASNGDNNLWFYVAPITTPTPTNTPTPTSTPTPTNTPTPTPTSTPTPTPTPMPPSTGTVSPSNGWSNSSIAGVKCSGINENPKLFTSTFTVPAGSAEISTNGFIAGLAFSKDNSPKFGVFYRVVNAGERRIGIYDFVQNNWDSEKLYNGSNVLTGSIQGVGTIIVSPSSISVSGSGASTLLTLNATIEFRNFVSEAVQGTYNTHLMVRDHFGRPASGGNGAFTVSGVSIRYFNAGWRGIDLAYPGVNYNEPTFDLTVADNVSLVSRITIVNGGIDDRSYSPPQPQVLINIADKATGSDQVTVAAQDFSGNCNQNNSFELWKDNWFQVNGGGIMSFGGMNVGYVPSGSYIINSRGSVLGGAAWIRDLGSYSVPTGQLKQTNAWLSDGFDSVSFSTASLKSSINNVKTAGDITAEVLGRASGDIVFISGSKTISSSVNTIAGKNRAMIVYVDGNLTVESSAVTLDGLYMATGKIDFANTDGLADNEGTLAVNGGVVANIDNSGSDNLEINRNLASSNTTDPAVVINYYPGIIFNEDIRNALWSKVTTIREVLP